MTTDRTRIVLTGGGTGGHLYPLLAVAEELLKEPKGTLELYYIGPPSPWDVEIEERGIPIRRILSSKLRRYFDLRNLFDVPKFCIGLAQALVHLYILMPDAVFSKGGPGALAVVLVARFYRIPVVIHESDAVPGLTNRLSAPFAERIGIAFAAAARYFPAKKVALVGNPLRSDLLGDRVETSQAKHELGFDPHISLLLVLGGSQGAAALNRFIIDNLSMLLPLYQVLHQVGSGNEKAVKETLGLALRDLDPALRTRYRSISFLPGYELRRALEAADIVMERAGAGSIYELAYFGRAALLVPLASAAGNHQHANAFEYASTGAAVLLAEDNLGPHLVLRELEGIVGKPERRAAMEAAARAFYKPDAAHLLAQAVLGLARR